MVERERQFKNRTLEKGLRTPAEEREQRLAVAQIKEDFAHIQTVNNELARAGLGTQALDFKFVAKSASEIKKCAGRLKYNLVLPEPEGEQSARTNANAVDEAEQLKSSLSALKGLVIKFVNNPMFKVGQVVDVKSAATARADLEQIIEVSDRVRKLSEKLNKAAQKSQ